MNVFATFRPALVLLAVFTLLTGAAYPALVTVLATAFPVQAHGSLVDRGGKVVGSSLIAQSFVDPAHFWSRPSATSPQAYNASASSGSNLGPLNPALTDAVKARVDALKAADDAAGVAPHGAVPVDLVTASASGLDPHESPAAARYQVARVAKASGVPIDRLQRLVEQHTEGPQLGFLGNARVNVLALNLALDTEHASTSR